MKSGDLKRLLAKHGCTFENLRSGSGSGHVRVRRGALKTIMPVHGSNKELGHGPVRKILKDLGITP